jgi:RNA polymerase sigma-70 factor (ECF subfamily)
MAERANTSQPELVAAFLANAPADWPAERSGELAADLTARWSAGHEAWPGVVLDRGSFVRHLAERVTAGALPAVERAADLYLACACVHRNAEAAAALHGLLRDIVPRVARDIDRSDAFLDDVRQALAEKLLTTHGDEPPRIAEYAGRATLRGWLLTVARRTALNLRRRKGEQAHQSLRSSVGLSAVAEGPEMALLKVRYKAEFEDAIRTAFSTLPARDRSLLVSHLVSGVTLPRLAATYGVSRATITRWLAGAREALQQATERQLRDRLRVTPSEYDSLIALVRSQLELSLADVVKSVSADR